MLSVFLKRFSLMGALAAACAFGGDAAKPVFKPAAKDGLLSDVKVQDGYTATMYATPPEVGYPTGLVCAPNGDLFVAIDQNGSLGHDPNRGFIVRCIDADGDGKAEKVVPFSKLDSPRGLVHTGDKLFVLNPPTLTVYKINPDGSASEPEILIKSMGGGHKHPRGADHTTNQIQIGIDGWIYIAVGDFGFFKAVDKNGKELEYMGGGVARVRQDGTELELVSHGQRNIYDVAVSPLLDLFTRDNTNDGDGWDVHLSHVISGANYGYPSYYKSFRDEMIPEIVDYGGGSPCGSLYLDEPGFPDGVGNALYTCEWGRGPVFRHPLETNGASFKTQQVPFVEMTRATDMEVDGQGRLYICSWKNGGFSYAKPDVGYITRVTYNENKAAPFPDLGKASDADLLKFIASNSHFKRIHTQHEILRRGAKPEFIEGLEKIATAEGPLAGRVAALFTLKQLLGEKANATLIKLAGNASIKEYAIRALADRKSHGKDVPTKLFIDALGDTNPRVRLQAATALWRLERKESAEALIPVLADGDYAVSHLAFRTLVALKAGEECLKALDKSPTNAPGVLKVLGVSHDPKVVDGLLERLGKAQDPVVKQGILKALCRLYFKEAQWDGSWWGTRPDSSGPYFKSATWESTEKIGAALKAALGSADAATLKTLPFELQKHKIDMPEAMAIIFKMADEDPATRASVVTMLGNRKDIPADGIPLLEKVAISETDEPALRLKAFDALQKSNKQDAVTRALVAFTAGEKPKTEMVRARESFVRDGKRGGQVGYYAKLASSEKAAERDLAFAVLVHVVANKQSKKDQKDAATKAIDASWSTPGAANLLKVIAQTKMDGYAPQIKAKLADGNAEVAAAAAAAAKALKIDAKAAAAPAKPKIGSMTPELAIEAAMKAKGDEKLGSELFLKQNCVNCHTLTKAETLKGPFLGDVATRYKRAELLESVMKPSAKIAQGFQSFLIKMKDGRRIEGFISKESAEEIEVRTATGEATMLPVKDIEKRGNLEHSIMPIGLADTLTVDELASLVTYLESLKTAK